MYDQSAAKPFTKPLIKATVLSLTAVKTPLTQITGNSRTTVAGGSFHKYHFCRDKRRVLSRQKYACRNKAFVSTKIGLSRQTQVCRDVLVAIPQNTCSVATNVLSQQKLYLWQLPRMIENKHETTQSVRLTPFSDCPSL